MMMGNNFLKVGCDLFDEEIRQHMMEKDIVQFSSGDDAHTLFVDFSTVDYVLVEPFTDQSYTKLPTQIFPLQL